LRTEEIVYARPPARPSAHPPADIPQSNNQFFPSENLVNNATAEINIRIIAVLLHLQNLSINSNVAPKLCRVQNALRFEVGNQTVMGGAIR
jgi:hypothetical protein